MTNNEVEKMKPNSSTAEASSAADVRCIGETVSVELPGGIYTGKIFKIYPEYGFNKELKYEIHGKNFVTITSERTIVAT